MRDGRGKTGSGALLRLPLPLGSRGPAAPPHLHVPSSLPLLLCRDGRLYLRLDWTAAQLEGFDQAAWGTPAVHESASDAAMAPTLAVIAVRWHGKGCCCCCCSRLLALQQRPAARLLLHAPTLGASSPPSAVQAADTWAAKKARAKSLPQAMLDELKGAARAYEPGVPNPMPA